LQDERYLTILAKATAEQLELLLPWCIVVPKHNQIIVHVISDFGMLVVTVDFQGSDVIVYGLGVKGRPISYDRGDLPQLIHDEVLTWLFRVQQLILSSSQEVKDDR